MLTGFALGELSQQQVSQVQKHLNECNLCKRELKRLQSLLDFTENLSQIKADKQMRQAAEHKILETTENKNITTTALPEAGQENIWRKFMKKRITKYAAVIMITFIVLGLIPFHETTVLGQIIQNTTNTLARLRAMVLNKNIPVENYIIENPIDKSIIIFTNSSEYSSFEISSLEHFLNEQNIYFSQKQNSNIKYAAIPYDLINNLHAFLGKQNGYEFVTSLRMTAFAGQEAMIAEIGNCGLALTAFQDENNILNVDAAFHNEQDGFEINQIKLNNEAILISGVIGDSNANQGKYTTILLQPEVMSNE